MTEEQKYIDQIDEEMNEAIDEATWGKPASDIITRIESMESAKPSRAIWEMVQNARDVSVREGAEIEFSIADGKFIFRHNGLPFTAKSLHSLNIQTSSKVRDDIVQVGQYGTGFLTTHKFGLKFILAGSLQLTKCGKYVDFQGLHFDRSPRDKGHMISNLKEQQRQISSLGHGEGQGGVLKDVPGKYTEFCYTQDYDVERERAIEAFISAPDLTPHVLALNELVNSISFRDTIQDHTTIFRRKEKRIIESHDLYDFSMVETAIHRNYDGENGQGRDYDYQIYMLESKEKEERTGSSRVTVILPLMNDSSYGDGTSRINVFRFLPNKPNFFIYLPLLGTEEWGVNFLFHSPSFTCADESRSSLRFVGNGQNNDFQAEQNKEIVALAEKMIFSFIETHLDRVSDRKLLSFVNFSNDSPNGKLADFYREKHGLWVSRMESYPLAISPVEEGVFVKPSSLKGLCSDICKYAEGGEEGMNQSFLDAVYSILASRYKSILPAKEEILFWSDRFREWYRKEESSHFFSIQDVVDIIRQETGIQNLGRENILEFDKFLANNKLFSYFENYAIIPNEGGILKKKDELVMPSSFNATTREVMKVLIPHEYNRFVDAGFSSLTQFTSFSDSSLKVQLSAAISTLQSDQQTCRDKYKRYVIQPTGNHRPDNVDSSCLSMEKVTALIRYASMVIKPGSVSNEAKILSVVKNFHDFHEEITDTLDDFDARSACRTLAQDVFFTFTVKYQSTMDEHVKRLVENVYANGELSSMLREYSVYRNQNGDYRYSEQLKKQLPMPQRLKEIYDVIVLDGTSRSVGDVLLDPEYDSCFVGDGTCLDSELASEIFRAISERRDGEEKNYPDISSYAHSGEVLEIIRRMDDTEEGRLWTSLFSALDKDKATVTMSIIDNKDKKESIFKLMQEEDSDKLKAICDISDKIKDKSALKALSELADSDNLTLILYEAKALKDAQLERERQFNFKYTIGKIIEDELRKEIGDSLSCEFRTSDIQNGQDMVISYKGKPLYYIESKAKWNFTDPAHMSSQQMKQAVREQGHYALCCVDCTPDTGARIDMEATREDVCAAHDEILANTYVHTDIGETLSPTLRPVIDEEDRTTDDYSSKIMVRGDFRCNIPKKVFNAGIPFSEFLSQLKTELKKDVSGLE